MAVALVYETHSITLDNESGHATGWLPGELSPRGRLLAAELGERRRGAGLAAVFSSDLRRAVQTVEIAFAGSGIPTFTDPRLRECDYGTLNGAPADEVFALRRISIETPFPAGESYRDVVARTRSFLADLAPYDGRRVLVVAHSANRFALDHLLAGVPLEELVDAPFHWREGWDYDVPVPFSG